LEHMLLVCLITCKFDTTESCKLFTSELQIEYKKVSKRFRR